MQVYVCMLFEIPFSLRLTNLQIIVHCQNYRFYYIKTLINLVILENPQILYTLPCTWNLQLYEYGISSYCNSTWNRPSNEEGIHEPQLLHADRINKTETAFWLKEPRELANSSKSLLKWSEFCNIISIVAEDLAKHYVAIRSQYHMMNGYQFRNRQFQIPHFDLLQVESNGFGFPLPEWFFLPHNKFKFHFKWLYIGWVYVKKLIEFHLDIIFLLPLLLYHFVWFKLT